jgi:Tfp pilus assembly protein PilF
MLLLAEVLLQKSDPGRARTMLQHAAKLLGDQSPKVLRLREFLGEVTGEISPLGGGRKKPLGPLIGGKGAILNVEDDSVAELEAPEQVVSKRKGSSLGVGKWAWIGFGALVVALFAFSAFRMGRTAGRVKAAVDKAQKATRTGGLESYQEAHKALRAALEHDQSNPDLRAWIAKIEARMALEYLVEVERVPAAIFEAEKIHGHLRKNPPGWLRRFQARLGLAHRSDSWGQEWILEARAIQQLMQGVAPHSGAGDIRAQTVTMLDEGLKKHPTALDLRYVRGVAHISCGDPVKAQADLEAVLAKENSHLPAQLALAFLHLEQGSMVEAQERFNRVLGLSPDNLRARLGLILTRLVRSQELAQASRDLQSIIAGEKAPRLIRGWHNLAQAWLYFGRGQLDEAYGTFKDVGRTVMPDPYWLSWYIRLGLLLGDVDRARRPLELGLAALRSPKDPLVQAFRLEVDLMEGLAEQVGPRAAAIGRDLPPEGVAARRLGLLVARSRLARGEYEKAAKGFDALAGFEPEAADRSFLRAYSVLAHALAARQGARTSPAAPKDASGGAPPRPAKKAATAPRKGGEAPGKADQGSAGSPGDKPPGESAGATAVADPETALAALDKGSAKPIVAYVRALLATDQAKARAFLQIARRHHRDATAASARLAALEIAAGEVAKGSRTLDAAFALAPAHYPALATRARLRHALGNGPGALEDLTALCYAGVHAELPKGLLSRLRYTADWSARLAGLDRKTLCPSILARPEDLYLRAELYMEQDQTNLLDLARLYIALGRSAGGDPLTADLLDARTLLVGEAAPAQAKQAVEALEAAQKTHREAAARSGALQAALGTAYQAAGDAKAAAEAFRRATQLAPTKVSWLTSLGWVELARGEQAASVKAFGIAAEEAAKQEADPAKVRSRLHFALGRALMAEGKARDLAAAKKAMEEAMRMDPQLFQAQVEIARIALIQKQPEVAIKQLDDLLKYDEGHPDALLLYLQILTAGPKEGRGRIPELTSRLVKTARFDISQGNLADGRFWLEEILAKVQKSHPGASLALAELLARTQAGKAKARSLLEEVQKTGSPEEKKQAAALLGKL